ncbi:H/ACA ribonucleoprotein complex non-core subunit NAF1 [Operophtera brumata]|uniref:H/ACA ribonucleoprotein complex non-core subunit NAF1 n=1 Tax=Operophtera brumata TaxID=104452 RepID=A0A0L7LPH7_OPEBR|nr:H/ACA ribonucleoprotein complex non-core subunit NAF1 [Operophtera brumata]
MENQDDNNKNVSLSLIAEYGGSDSESDTEVSNDNTVKDRNDDSDAPELSEMVLKNNIINACAHGPLSRSADCDDDDDDGSSVRHMIIDPQSENGYEVALYREDISDSDESASSDTDSDVDSIKDVEEVLSSGDEGTGVNKASKPEAPKVNGEMGLEDLPPIEDLAISLPAKETLKIGVTEPHYAIRFNTHQHVLERGVSIGADVFIAPESKLTSYVMKGSDASWKNDIEPPPSQVEYSDDEEERRVKRDAKNKHNETEDPRKVPQRNQRPSESSSRFGSGPSRGRNPFAASRRNPNTSQRYARPWNVDTDVRTPPQHPNEMPFGAPPTFPYMYGPFNTNSPPPFMYANYPRMSGPMPHMGLMRPNAPIFGSNFYNTPGAQPQNKLTIELNKF